MYNILKRSRIRLVHFYHTQALLQTFKLLKVAMQCLFPQQANIFALETSIYLHFLNFSLKMTQQNENKHRNREYST